MENAVLRRERELLQQQLDATRDMLQQQLDATRDYREQIRYLSQMLHDMQQRYDRLLEAPRAAPPAQVSRATPRRSQSVGRVPESWQRILEYLREQARPMSPQAVKQVLGLDSTPRHVMARMARAGFLRRVEQGQYIVAEEAE